MVDQGPPLLSVIVIAVPIARVMEQFQIAPDFEQLPEGAIETVEGGFLGVMVKVVVH